MQLFVPLAYVCCVALTTDEVLYNRLTPTDKEFKNSIKDIVWCVIPYKTVEYIFRYYYPIHGDDLRVKLNVPEPERTTSKQ